MTWLPLFYDAILEPTRWPDALGGFAAQFGANHAIFAASNGGANGPQIDWVGVVPEYQERFRHFVRDNNPIQVAPGHRYHGQPYTDRMVMPTTAFQRTNFYQDWCRPQRIETVMGAAIIQDARGIVLLGLGRADPFSDAELVLHRSLMPELDRIMALRMRLMEVDLQRARLRALLDQVGTPILLATSAARLLHANRAAEALLRAGDVLVLAQGRLAGVTERQTDALRSLIRRAGSNAAGQNLAIHGEHGGIAGIAILPVHADHGWGLKAPLMASHFSSLSLNRSTARQQRCCRRCIGSRQPKPRWLNWSVSAAACRLRQACWGSRHRPVRAHRTRIFAQDRDRAAVAARRPAAIAAPGAASVVTRVIHQLVDASRPAGGKMVAGAARRAKGER